MLCELYMYKFVCIITPLQLVVQVKFIHLLSHVHTCTVNTVMQLSTNDKELHEQLLEMILLVPSLSRCSEERSREWLPVLPLDPQRQSSALLPWR